MNSFMSWVGGKKALREEVVQRFPLYYERYIEVFGGGGWVLFHKPPGRDLRSTTTSTAFLPTCTAVSGTSRIC